MFKPGKLYKHEKNTTVGMEIVKAFYVKEKSVWKLRVSWVNIGACHAPWDLNIIENVEIPRSALPSWKLIRHDARPALPPSRFFGRDLCMES